MTRVGAAPVTAVFKVLDGGFCTTIQDKGRQNFLHIGVPASGPLDSIAFRLSNALVGNEVGTPALEILVRGPTLEVLAESLRVAFVGGASGLVISGETERNIAMGQSVLVKRGDVLGVKALKHWPSGYLAIEGGFAACIALGSAATYMRAGIGGMQGRALTSGEILNGRLGSPACLGERALGRSFPANLDQRIRVVLGPQADAFTAEAKERLLDAPFKVTPHADRMGFRLEGPSLQHTGSYDLVSDGIVPGAIQVPGNCQPIVMMVDHQTMGGYPKIATVVSADISVLGRRSPGSLVRFQEVSRSEAENIRREQETMLRSWIAGLGQISEGATLNVERLYGANLIDGVRSALD